MSNVKNQSSTVIPKYGIINLNNKIRIITCWYDCRIVIGIHIEGIEVARWVTGQVGNPSSSSRPGCHRSNSLVGPPRAASRLASRATTLPCHHFPRSPLHFPRNPRPAERSNQTSDEPYNLAVLHAGEQGIRQEASITKPHAPLRRTVG